MGPPRPIALATCRGAAVNVPTAPVVHRAYRQAHPRSQQPPPATGPRLGCLGRTDRVDPCPSHRGCKVAHGPRAARSRACLRGMASASSSALAPHRSA